MFTVSELICRSSIILKYYCHSMFSDLSPRLFLDNHSSLFLTTLCNCFITIIIDSTLTTGVFDHLLQKLNQSHPIIHPRWSFSSYIILFTTSLILEFMRFYSFNDHSMTLSLFYDFGCAFIHDDTSPHQFTIMLSFHIVCVVHYRRNNGPTVIESSP